MPSGFQDEACGGQEKVRLFDHSKVPRFWAFSLAFLGKESHERNQSKETIRRGGFLYEPWNTGGRPARQVLFLASRSYSHPMAIPRYSALTQQS